MVTEASDRQLPLDLRNECDCDLLRRYVRRGLDAVVEQPGGPNAVQAVVTGITGRHVLEIVVPLATQPPASHPSPVVVQARTTGDGYYLPGAGPGVHQWQCRTRR